MCSLTPLSSFNNLFPTKFFNNISSKAKQENRARRLHTLSLSSNNFATTFELSSSNKALQPLSMTMAGFYLAFSLLPLLGFNDSEVLKLMSFQELKPALLEVSVTETDVPVVSSSVSQAESWLNTHVLVHSPPTRITKVVVGKGVLCNKISESMWSSVLPSVKNLHSVLAKWGLLKETELSVALSSDCLDHSQIPSRFKSDAPKKLLKPLLGFLQAYNLTYSIEQPSHSLVGDIVMKGEAEPMSRNLQV